MAALAVLAKKREALQSRILAVQDKIHNYKPEETTISALKVWDKGVDGMKVKLDDLYEETFIACTTAEFATQASDFETLFNALNYMSGKLSEILAPTVQQPPSVTVTPYKEKVDLPSFDGTITKWKTFHDLFLHKVKVEGISSGASKLAILQVKLTGEAAPVISSVALTDANFDSAWARLIKRFEDKRDLIHAHIEEFDKSPSLTSESARGLRSLLDTINNMMLSLTNIGVNISDSDVFIVYYAVKKLDAKTRAWWALATKSEAATVTELCDFLETRSKALLESTSSSSSHLAPRPAPVHAPEISRRTHHVSSARCPQCSSSHQLWSCPNFKALPTQARWDLVKANQRCFNCLGPHKAPCHSTQTCHIPGCNKPHHTLLHPTQQDEGNGETTPTPKSSSHASIPRNNLESVPILGTVIVDVKDSSGVKQPCRVFVDDGSEVSFISERCLHRLGLKSQKAYVPLNVVGNMPGKPARGKVHLTMESRSQQYALNLELLVLPEFTGLVPGIDCDSNWPHLQGLTLSDPQYHQAQLCDILLGGKKSGHVLLPQVIQDLSNPDAPVAWNTRFGWMVKGEAPPVSTPSRPIRQRSNHAAVSTSTQESSVAKFWAQEDSFSLLPQIKNEYLELVPVPARENHGPPSDPHDMPHQNPADAPSRGISVLPSFLLDTIPDLLPVTSSLNLAVTPSPEFHPHPIQNCFSFPKMRKRQRFRTNASAWTTQDHSTWHSAPGGSFLRSKPTWPCLSA
jgi:hypothetical protein